MNVIKKLKKEYPIVFNPIYLTIVGLVIVIGLLIGGNAFIASKTASATPSPTIIPLISITPEPSQTAYPTYKPVIKPLIAIPTVDPDPPVLCNVSPNCGGGTTPLKKSECDNSVCCQIGNTWVFYKDKSKCTTDQNNSTSLNQQVNQQRALNYANTSHSEICIQGAKLKADNCNYVCNRDFSNRSDDSLSQCLSSCFYTLESDLKPCTP